MVEIDAINSKKWTFCLTIIVVIHDATPSSADTAMYNRLNKKSETGIIISLLTGLYNRFTGLFCYLGAKKIATQLLVYEALPFSGKILSMRTQ